MSKFAFNSSVFCVLDQGLPKGGHYRQEHYSTRAVYAGLISSFVPCCQPMLLTRLPHDPGDALHRCKKMVS